MITLKDVRFTYEALRMNFNLEVAASEFLAVIGPSGAGKSTLLNLIAGFEDPISGSIEIGGRNVSAAPPALRPVSMVFQDHNSFAHLDVWTNVALGISPSLRLSQEGRHEVDAALTRVGLASLARRKPGELSGGERQRIAIARALVRNRPVLLLDEPFTALGPGLRRDMLELVKELRRERSLTILLVTHEPDDARIAASHVAFIAKGEVVTKLPLAEFFATRGIPGLDEYLGARHG